MPILLVEGLVKSYGRRRVVDGVSMEVKTGEIVGLLGPNGAGKTTSFKMICGLTRPDQGKVILQGVDVTSWPLHQRSRDGGMGYLPQQSSVFAKLSVQENLRGMMQLLGFSWKQQRVRCQELLEQFKITHIRKSKAGTLSGGERRRLEIARCLVADPKIIMLDEPFAGIDPVTVQSVQVVIKELAVAGISVLITDHAAREILQITDRTYVVSEGRILCSGTAEEIVTHEEVKKKYLGEIEMPATRGELETDDREPVILPVGNLSKFEGAPSVAETRPRIKPAAESNPRIKPTTESKSPTETQSPSKPKATRDRPKIVFSKPRRNKRVVVAPFKETDLD